MEDYVEFFGGVDTLDVTDLMQPTLVFGGSKSKSASTVRISSRKLTKRKKTKTRSYFDESIVSILGSWDETAKSKPCPSFSELESKYIAGEEERILNELAAVVDVAHAVGGFSDSDSDESNVAAPLAAGIDLADFDGDAPIDLANFDGAADDATYDLTALDSPDSIGTAGMTIMEIE